MLITGLERFTLLDYPGKVAAIAFTYGCDMRCPYCHNPELVTEKLNSNLIFTEEDILSFLKRRIGKLDALVITGGEPTLHKDLLSFIQKVKDLGMLVKLDTNGGNFVEVEKIMKSGLVDYWAMDIKYADELYQQGLNGGRMITDIARSIELIMKSARDYEFRTTYMKGLHTVESAREIGEMIKGAKNYYIQNFRPGKTIDKTLNSTNSFSNAELLEIKRVMEDYVQSVVIR